MAFIEIRNLFKRFKNVVAVNRIQLDVIEGEIITKPKRVNGTPEFQRAVNELVPMIEEMAPGVPNARWLAIRLLDGDSKVQQALMSGELGQIFTRQQQADVQFSRKMAVEGRQ